MANIGPNTKLPVPPVPSAPPKVKLTELFHDAIQLLRSQTYPPAPPLGGHGAAESEQGSSDFNFSPLWDHFDTESSGRSVEERLGKAAWVLDVEYGNIHEACADDIAEEGATTVIQDTTTSSSPATEATSLGNAKVVSPAVTFEALEADNCKTATDAIPATADLSPLPLPQVPTLQPILPYPGPPLLLNTNLRPYITNVHNSAPVLHVPPHKPIYPQIEPSTYETRSQKMQNVAWKLHHSINADLRIDPLNPCLFFRPAPEQGGLHVFIDISNIIIGFVDCLKTNRGIPVKEHVSQPPFSFNEFVLILERCRPTARRVVVGSCIRDLKMPYHMEAASLGYEVNVLERVSKPSFPKEKKGSKSPAARASPPENSPLRKNAEQGVDEVLQMKILESMVDNLNTPSTIVLATGDAAVAEFSGGFLPNVERALRLGWNVEVVGWKKGMSRAYLDLEKEMSRDESIRGRLKIILLDDMAEELLAWYRSD